MGIIVDSTVSIACESDGIGTNQKGTDATNYGVNSWRLHFLRVSSE